MPAVPRIIACLLPVLASVQGCTEYDYGELSVRDVWAVPTISGSSDILVVIDDSASMAEEQERLGENFHAFTDVVAGAYADFQIGVVTTDVDVSDAGVLRGGVLTPDTPELEATFLEAVTVGTKGSRYEQGYEASSLAVAAGANPGFVRSEARLHVVFLSDEDDQSDGRVPDYLDTLRDAAGSGGFTAHAIVGDEPDGCASGIGAASAGTRYLTAAVQTSGYTDSICSDDYTEILERVGLDVAGLQDTYLLNQVAEPGTIQVWVDSVEMHERDIDGWLYEPGDNAVVFSGLAIPRAGMQVVAEYELLLGVSTEDDAQSEDAEDSS
jgi:hypothetical protein